MLELEQKKQEKHALVKLLVGSMVLLTIVNYISKAPFLLKNNFYEVFRYLNARYVIHQMADNHTVKSERVVLFFEKEDYAMAPIVMGVAEEYFDQVNQIFKFKPEQQIPVVIHPDKKSLNKKFGWDADESAMGVYWAGVIRVLSPQVWIDEDDPELISTIYSVNGPVVHEYIHYVVDKKTRGNYTRWFTEALAQYWERELTGFQFNSEKGCLGQELYPLKSMDFQFDSLPNQALAYSQSLAAAEYMYQVHGSAPVEQLMYELSRGKTLSQGMEASFGYDLSKFEEKLTEWIEQQQRVWSVG